jgi:hypothetical protein
MAIQNVRFESPLVTSSAPVPVLKPVAFDPVITSIVGGDLPAALAMINLDGPIPLWEFEIQASALNCRPAALMLGIEVDGTVEFTNVELSPGGSYHFKKADLSMLPIFKTQAEVEASAIVLASITFVRARTEAFSSPDGSLTFDITGISVTY